jgi:hypothetical protein
MTVTAPFYASKKQQYFGHNNFTAIYDKGFTLLANLITATDMASLF